MHYLLNGDPMMEGPGSPRPSEIMESQIQNTGSLLEPGYDVSSVWKAVTGHW